MKGKNICICGEFKLITFTDGEQKVLEICVAILKKHNSSSADLVEFQVKQVRDLAQLVDAASSPLKNLLEIDEKRNIDSLVEKICTQGLSLALDIPSKAHLGHTFTLLKLHLFGLLLKLIPTIEELREVSKEVEEEYNDLVFILMAEDLYSNIVSQKNVEKEPLKEAAKELITLWDKRTSGYLSTFGRSIRQLWQARNTLVPVLGTLLGTMEIMKLSSNVPKVWFDFLTNINSNIEVAYALEEFLFDLTYEELKELREYMNKENIRVVNRSSAYHILKKQDTKEKDCYSSLTLYKSFKERQQIAIIRGYKESHGPKMALEEYFVLYLLKSSDYLPEEIDS